jgi:ribokinase
MLDVPPFFLQTSPMPKPIIILGSINMDLVCRTPHMPAGGETILGSDFVTVPGGKGANQAVAAAKLGGDVHMIGRVGDDDFGQRLLNGLKNHGVNTDFVTVTEGMASGVAMILVDKKGENSIIVAPGANAKVSPADVDAAETLIASACCVVMQLEIPLDTVKHAIAMCQRLGVPTILDPAPAPVKLPRALYGVDVLSPNQSEAEVLLDLDRTHIVKKKRVIDPKQIAGDLLARGPRSVVLKLGRSGAISLDRDGDGAGAFHKARAFKVKVVDTTAAGDAFTAGLAVARAEGMAADDALRFACAAGALACTGFGAQPALPARAAVEKLIDR